jgi:CRP-like cAMP-binding protein
MSAPEIPLPVPQEPRNRLLRRLAPQDLDRLLPFLEPVRLASKTVLWEPLVPIDDVYFIEEGVASIVSLMSDRTAVEIATVGFEGMAGLAVYWGGVSSVGQAFMQVPGTALRMRAEVLRDEVRRAGALAAGLGLYSQALLTMVAQSSACNRLHTIEQRCARWLLATHDRVRGDTFELTQLFLAQMLGVRRASVNLVAKRLHDQNLIDYSRGRVTILNRGGLEAAACECYLLVAAEFDRLLEGRWVRTPLDDVLFSDDGMTLTTEPDRPLPGG